MSGTTEEEVRRKDDSFMRKIAVGVTTAIIMQAGFSVYFAGSLSNQVANNTKALALVAQKLQSQEQLNIALSRVETLISGLSSTTQRLIIKVDAMDREQQRRTSIVDRADEYMRSKNSK